jgi:hypothetical protein
MKINKEKIAKIRELRKEGKTYVEIAKIMNMWESQVIYWASEEDRKKKIKRARDHFRNLSPEQKKVYYQSRKEYITKYVFDRYNNDPVFREKAKARQREYERRMYNKNKIK